MSLITITQLPPHGENNQFMEQQCKESPKEGRRDIGEKKKYYSNKWLSPIWGQILIFHSLWGSNMDNEHIYVVVTYYPGSIYIAIFNVEYVSNNHNTAAPP